MSRAEKEKSRLENAAEAIVKSFNKEGKEGTEIYRQHLETLIQFDFINLQWSFGNMNFGYFGKSGTFRDVTLLILELAKHVSPQNENEAYEAKDGKKDVAYG